MGDHKVSSRLYGSLQNRKRGGERDGDAVNDGIRASGYNPVHRGFKASRWFG